MPRTKKGTPPSYPGKPHKGQARITVRLPGGKRRELYLGPFGSEESRAEYRRVLAQLEVTGGHYPAGKVINQRVEHVKRVFAWAVSEELVPVSVHESLLRVPGLRRGHDGTFDHPPVKPVPEEHIQATLPFLRPQVAAMVQLQWLVG